MSKWRRERERERDGAQTNVQFHVCVWGGGQQGVFLEPHEVVVVSAVRKSAATVDV